MHSRISLQSLSTALFSHFKGYSAKYRPPLPSVLSTQQTIVYKRPCYLLLVLYLSENKILKGLVIRDILLLFIICLTSVCHTAYVTRPGFSQKMKFLDNAKIKKWKFSFHIHFNPFTKMQMFVNYTTNFNLVPQVKSVSTHHYLTKLNYKLKKHR